MSTRTRTPKPPDVDRSANLFAALGDVARLRILNKLSRGQRLSISQLSADASITRQAVTKHLNVLQQAGLVRDQRHGRERLFEMDPEPLQTAQESLDLISKQWDDALSRLKTFVESTPQDPKPS